MLAMPWPSRLRAAAVCVATLLLAATTTAAPKPGDLLVAGKTCEGTFPGLCEVAGFVDDVDPATGAVEGVFSHSNAEFSDVAVAANGATAAQAHPGGPLRYLDPDGTLRRVPQVLYADNSQLALEPWGDVLDGKVARYRLRYETYDLIAFSASGSFRDVEVAHDGTVYVLRPDGSVDAVVTATPAVDDFTPIAPAGFASDFAVARNGDLIGLSPAGIRRLAPPSPTLTLIAPPDPPLDRASAITVGADGTIYAAIPETADHALDGYLVAIDPSTGAASTLVTAVSFAAIRSLAAVDCDTANGACVVPTECSAGGDCDDGKFCTGVDVCADGRCGRGPDACPRLGCDEDLERCVACDEGTPPLPPGRRVLQRFRAVPGGACVDSPACSAGQTCDEGSHAASTRRSARSTLTATTAPSATVPSAARRASASCSPRPAPSRRAATRRRKPASIRRPSTSTSGSSARPASGGSAQRRSCGSRSRCATRRVSPVRRRSCTFTASRTASRSWTTRRGPTRAGAAAAS